MTRCEWIRFAYRALPLAAWRAFLLGWHIDRCPVCQSLALGDAAIRSLGVLPVALQDEPPLRPFAALIPPLRQRRHSFAWQRVYGALLTATLLGAVVAVLRMPPPSRSRPTGMVVVSTAEAEPEGFAVLESRVNGQTARPVLFKPGTPGMTIVWFAEFSKRNGGETT